MHRRLVLPFVVVIAAGCARTLEEASGDVQLRDYVADVEMRSATGTLLGTLHLVNAPSGSARLVGTLTGIPAGRHGIHVHAVGRCDGTGFESAGAHFNPMGKQHGLANPAGAHAGDAPNIEADATMRAPVDVIFTQASLDAAATNGILDADGAAVVVHAGPDDQRSDPAGNSGARIACGVVARR